MKLSSVFILILFTLHVKAQVVRQPLSVRYAHAGAYSKNFSDIFSAASNQASLAELKTSGFGVYGERRFMLEELNGYTTIIAVPTPSGTFGFQGDYFGSSGFNETQLGLLYGRKVTDKIDVGAKFNYYTVRVRGYGSASAINFEAGAIFHLTDKLYTGIHVYNPAGSKLGKRGGEKLASAYRFGVGYEVSEKLFISTEIVKHEDRAIIVNAGLQYNLLLNVFIRAGTSAGGNNTYLSVGLPLSFGRVDVNTAYHPQLGFTPGLLLLVNFTKTAKD